jgi:DNA-binding PadR family transcriptional regulator
VSNSRSFRRRLAASREARPARPRFPWGGPSLSTVRKWMKQLEAAGDIEPKGTERTGKPGRPPMMYGLTEQGKRRNWTAPQLTDAITRAIHDRKFKDVPLLLRLLKMKDPEQVERVIKSLEAMAGAEADGLSASVAP